MKPLFFFAFFPLISLAGWIGQDKPAFPPEAPGRIEFVADAGSPQVFVFQEWQFKNVHYIEGQVEKIKVELLINTASLSTDWKDLEKNVKKKKAYFFVKKFPNAAIVVDGAESLGGNEYKSQAQFTIKGITRLVELRFTLEGRNVKGKGTLNRRLFDFTEDGPKDEILLSFEAVLPE